MTLTSLWSLLMVYLLLPSYAQAHKGHKHPPKLSEKNVPKFALIAIKKSAGKGHIAKSWVQVKQPKSVTKITVTDPVSPTKSKKTKEWKVHFVDNAIKDGKKDLWVFLSEAGSVLSVNHRGYSTITEKDAPEEAFKVIQDKVKAGKIPKSWLQIKKPTSVTSKFYPQGKEWVVVFDNPHKALKANKKKLYVFLNIKGYGLAVNYTGQ